MLFILSFLFLVISLFLSKVRQGAWAKKAIWFRVVSVFFSVSLLTSWFIKNSIPSLYTENSELKIINNLPQPIDFYLITSLDPKSEPVAHHVGEIRSAHYRDFFFPLTQVKQFRLVGNLGKKNTVYLSHHFLTKDIPIRQLEINNYVIQEESGVEKAQELIDQLKAKNRVSGIGVTLSILLLLLNVLLLVRKK